MVTPPASAALQRFVDDEIVRAPLLVDQVIDGALEHMQRGLPGMMPAERGLVGDLMQSVQSHRQHIVDYYIGSLRKQVAADSSRAAPAAAPAEPKLSLALSLVDEDEVAVDVEISHTIEAIRSVAEYELRELQTFTAALVGDMDVAHDHNPLRAETHARALWAASQALPLSRGYQLSFMRHASNALAQVLRKSFAGASSRLESMGIEPASHRTVILPSGSRRTRTPESSFSPDLSRIRNSMPVREAPAAPRMGLEQALALADAALRSLPPDAGATAYGQLREQQREQLVESATNPVDQQLVELLTRLFDAILADQALPLDVHLLLSRLQSPALRVALRDPQALDKETHPLWRLIDRIAFLGEMLAGPGDPDRDTVLRFVKSLLDQVVTEPDQSAALYEWALSRLQAQEQQRLERRCAAAGREIVQLQALEDRLAASQTTPSTLNGTLDVGQLDTVPADLIDAGAAAERPPSATAQTWLRQRRPGDWVRVFMQGRWVHAQVLWPGERGEIWLLGDGASAVTWAVRQRALMTLYVANLLDSIEPRSLLRHAAKRVMRRMIR